MYVIKHTDAPITSMSGIRHTTLAGSGQGLRQLSVWQQSVQPGGATPPHRHDCEEVVLCTGGQGELRIDNRETHGFGPGSTVIIPRNVLHQIASVGTEDLQFVAIFSTTPVEAYFPDGGFIELPWAS
ncbi:cupin domain-containing protein [Marinobacter sp. ATCH36]|uniref:cupin domain-containing protein n=1 Tax=Marinobacter sp. ATCH36 TaxID=2945106 RepID=UPI0020229B61|nr:cupin domain-containing protein [Marinobacter sp. ATCH36]MCL7943643.1 cupin domain-containing protein [Marinobacter sp. ATCH36]